MDTLNHITNKIDYYANVTNWGTDEIRENLWDDINNLRNHHDKNNLIENWKYKTAFETTEIEHMNGCKLFNLLSWETSFTLALLFSVYH
jgi:hypothetical protein